MPKIKRSPSANTKAIGKRITRSMTRASALAEQIAKEEAVATSQEPPFFFWTDPESEGGFLSPWYISPFEWQGTTYMSTGQCILALKAQAFRDEVSSMSCEALNPILSGVGIVPEDSPHNKRGRTETVG